MIRFIEPRVAGRLPQLDSQMSTWYTNEAFWRETYPFVFSEDAFDRAHADVDRALALVGGAPLHVLDLACGPARHTLPLALRGLRVTGVDVSPFMLERAHARAVAAGVDPEFVLADMRAFVRPVAFDIVFILGTSFGYFGGREDDDVVLGNVLRSLRPGGALLLEMRGSAKEIVARGWGARVEELPDGSVWIQRPQIVDDWTRVTHDDIVITSGSVHRFAFSYRLYSGQELGDRLLHAGFVDISLSGDLDGRPYGPGAPRLVVVGRKRP